VFSLQYCYLKTKPSNTNRDNSKRLAVLFIAKTLQYQENASEDPLELDHLSLKKKNKGIVSHACPLVTQPCSHAFATSRL